MRVRVCECVYIYTARRKRETEILSSTVFFYVQTVYQQIYMCVFLCVCSYTQEEEREREREREREKERERERERHYFFHRTFLCSNCVSTNE